MCFPVDFFVHVKTGAVIGYGDPDLICVSYGGDCDVKRPVLLHAVDDTVLNDGLKKEFHDQAVLSPRFDLLAKLYKFSEADLLNHDIILDTAELVRERDEGIVIND